VWRIFENKLYITGCSLMVVLGLRGGGEEEVKKKKENKGRKKEDGGRGEHCW
jgi:hypothetical protein